MSSEIVPEAVAKRLGYALKRAQHAQRVLRTLKRLGYALKRAQHALRVRMDEVLRPLGLTTAQYAVICVIEQEAGISNAGLARAAFVTPQTMTGILRSE